MNHEKHPKLRKTLHIVVTILQALFFVFLFGTIIVLIMLAIQHYNNADTNTPSYIEDTIKDIATIFTCITASFSLLVASLVRRESAQNRKKDRELEINQRWYNSLVIERHLDNTLKFFSNCINLVEKLKNLDETRESLSYHDYGLKCKTEIISPFTSEYTSVQYGLVSDIRIIDDNVSTNVNTLFERFQDNFLGEIDKKSPNYNMMKSYVYTTRQNLLSILKQFDLSYIPK